MENNEKKKSFGLTIILILVVGILLAASFVAGIKYSDNKDKKCNDKDTKESSNTVNSNEVSNSNTTVEKCTTPEQIPVGDLYVYAFDGGYGEALKVDNGTLYGRTSKDEAGMFTTYDYEFSEYDKTRAFTKILDNVKRIKSYNFGTDTSVTYLAILNDGTVKEIVVDHHKNTFKVVDFDELKGYKVDDITYAWSVRGTTSDYKGPFFKWTLKLVDGTIKKIEK
jgi:hypothetical protein